MRELKRLVRLGHWNGRIRFLLAIMAAWFRRVPAYRRLDTLLTAAKGEPHAIVMVIYCPKGMPADTRALIQALQHDPSIHLMIISKTPLLDQDAQFLKDQGCNITTVANRGFDFESYRDGVLTLLDSGVSFQKLTIMNDTFVVLNVPALMKLLIGADTPAPGGWTGFFLQGRKRARDRHLGAFCLTFDGQVARQRAFEQFWRAYKPSNNRDYTIRFGEIGLSKALFSADARFDVLYERQALIRRVFDQPAETIKVIAEGLHLLEILNDHERASLSSLDLAQRRSFLADKIANTENLRLMPIYSLLMDLPIAKRRNLRAYPGLAAWYETHIRPIETGT